MNLFFKKIIFLIVLVNFVSCKKNEHSTTTSDTSQKNEIEYSTNLSIYKYKSYSIVKISNPWPDANKDFTYILKEKNATIPDSLSKYTSITIPLQSIVVTSTTNIPFIEMLNEERKLLGFPHTDYISSQKTRQLIDEGIVKNVGQNERLDIEKLIDLAPEVIVAFGIDNNNPMIANLEKSGLKVLIQADWMEQSPLGKAEWIKLYAALFGKEKEGKKLFDAIVKNYNAKPKYRPPFDATVAGVPYKSNFSIISRAPVPLSGKSLVKWDKPLKALATGTTGRFSRVCK